MYDVLHDNVYRKSWDPAMLESFEIARLAPNSDVGYYSCESYNYITHDYFEILQDLIVILPLSLSCMFFQVSSYISTYIHTNEIFKTCITTEYDHSLLM